MINTNITIPNSLDYENKIKNDTEKNIQEFINNIKASHEQNEDWPAVTSVAKLLIMTTAFSYFDLKLSHKIAEISTKTFGLCLEKLVPNGGLPYLVSMVNPIAKLNMSMSKLFGSNAITKIFIPSLCEEIEFRWFVQEVLLRKLPKKIIERINPALTEMVDSMPARISRVAASALFFALCHTYDLGCSQEGGISVLIGGLLYGGLYEFNNHEFVNCINLHVTYNVLKHMTN